jgi:hypothetical protein
MDQNDFLIQIIKRPIKEHTRYMNFFYAKIESVDDELKKGRKLVTIPQLGWTTQDLGVWAWISDIKELKNPNDCYIQGKATGIEGMIPKAFDGNPTTDVLYEDNKAQIKVVYDEQTKQMTIQDQQNQVLFKQNSGEINITPATLLKMFGGTEAFVKGTTFEAWMTLFILALNAHTHSGVTTGTGVSGTPAAAFTAPTNWISTKIKGE